MTKVINLFGGSGLGKSTLAAALFAEMKGRGLHVELVREYVKGWAWQERKIGPFDQPYIFGKQSHAEAQLYGKVDYMVTDSPLLLSPIYEEFYTGTSIVRSTALEFLTKTKRGGIDHLNFLLKRHKPFDTRGRYETVETARKVDDFVREKLTAWAVDFFDVSVPDHERVEFILDHLLSPPLKDAV